MADLAGLTDHFRNEESSRLVNLTDYLRVLMTMDKEKLFPSTIYVRDCMREIFRLFHGDLEDEDVRRVLLGSPGVGTSVLFLIAALSKALTDSKPVVYFRKVREGKQVSAFVMNRTAEGVLDVYFPRRIKKFGHNKLLQEARELMECFGLDEDSCYSFLDGPRHDSTSDLEAIYSYFCTSGGHPQPKSGETGILYLWILPGWTASDAVDGFAALGFLPDDIRHAYFI